MKTILRLSIVCFIGFFSFAQNEENLDYFVKQAKENAPTLNENNHLLKIGEVQNSIIVAQNKAFQINATSEVMVAPYFNNDGKVIDITTAPSGNAFGYDVGITNGGLYSAQINVTKNLFNQAVTDNFLFQNKIQNNCISLSSEETTHTIVKNITDAYILAYQLQLQETFTKDILKDLEKRLQVVKLLVEQAVLMESDYLVLQLDVDGKTLELQQLQNNLKIAINQLYSLSGMPIGKVKKLEAPLLITNQNLHNFFTRKSLKMIVCKLLRINVFLKINTNHK